MKTNIFKIRKNENKNKFNAPQINHALVRQFDPTSSKKTRGEYHPLLKMNNSIEVTRSQSSHDRPSTQGNLHLLYIKEPTTPPQSSGNEINHAQYLLTKRPPTYRKFTNNDSASQINPKLTVVIYLQDNHTYQTTALLQSTSQLERKLFP